ncbi:C10 family peptidase [Spirosoma sp. SC4-14]|uniref:C10 family peptidase n=1 Tax=Spirosoma sp. SC4-14 TaxID=3128900 RepID=UPI0030CF2AB1
MHQVRFALFLVIISLSTVSAQLQEPVQKKGSYLLKTQWDQFGPYACYTPDNHVLGCWSTALAQIFYYHRLRPTGVVSYQCSKGYRIEDTLANHAVTWDQFATRIEPTTSELARNNVARFSYMTAEVIRKDFGTSQYLEMVNPVGQINAYFPCQAEFYVSFTEPIPIPKAQLDAIARKENIQHVLQRDEVMDLIRREIDAKRPVYFHFGNFTDYGHSTVIDGYRAEADTFWAHINYGSGGKRSGWYDLFKPIDVADDIKLHAFITVNPN